MARPLRPQYPGAVYHLTTRGNARQRIFRDDTDREVFCHTLAQVITRYGWLCHAYCLMENREYGYRLHEIAEHLGVHYATVSRRCANSSEHGVLCDCKT